jgi:hypothetical protein
MGASASRERFLAATGRLTGEEVTGEDVEFWDELWKLGSTSEEVRGRGGGGEGEGRN